MLKLGFIGAGPVGTTFGVRLSEQGYGVVAVADIRSAAAERFAGLVPGCRIFQNPQALVDAVDMVFITTADDFIPRVSSELKWRSGQMAVHCSGASTVQSLEAARQQGARVGSIHPCQTFAGIEQAIANLPGSTFAIEAEEPLKTTLTEMAQALKGDIVYLTSEDKVLYHAAAAMACNYFTTIVKLASDLWRNFGKTPADAIKAYMPLLRGTLTNIETVGFPKCLTGPIARGDVATIRRHLAALENYAAELLPLYKELGRFTIPIGQDKGSLTADRAEDLRTLLKH
ncbi:MAG: DUF2520 domain-containing protein [Desulfobacterales bacterium]|jgi:predicted short-subunit dehydrogenase-like oxidoreductase (DUF2520 family)|nr:DUF2520 domain-containing protein [Desulfobacterales bacterium]